jgi:nitroimidazol reductase NimA-like FMN-containing flavoprotein (pyridoxamine 5'-phosphate oxidase superfamily)
MLIYELTRAECAQILSRSHIGRLACARFDQPYIVPISFSFDAERDCVYGFSTVGQKIVWMRENPKVCLEVDDIADKDNWTTVVILGRYSEIHQAPEEAEARRRAQSFFQERKEWWLPAAARVTSVEHENMVLYRITLDRVTGRRTKRDS